MTPVCRLDELTPERGAAAIIGSDQVALFRVGARVRAVDHRDPRTGANVLARGIVGTAGDRWFVASPLYKERYDLESGTCLDDPRMRVRTWGVAVVDGVVHVSDTPDGD